MEPPGKILWFSLELTKLGIICGILHQEYLKMRLKKGNIFKDIKLEILNSIEISFMP